MDKGRVVFSATGAEIRDASAAPGIISADKADLRRIGVDKWIQGHAG